MCKAAVEMSEFSPLAVLLTIVLSDRLGSQAVEEHKRNVKKLRNVKPAVFEEGEGDKIDPTEDNHQDFETHHQDFLYPAHLINVKVGQSPFVQLQDIDDEESQSPGFQDPVYSFQALHSAEFAQLREHWQSVDDEQKQKHRLSFGRDRNSSIGRSMSPEGTQMTDAESKFINEVEVPANEKDVLELISEKWDTGLDSMHID